MVAFGTPDAAARREILAVHAQGAPVAETVSLDALAAETEGWSGAELAALCPDAARAALRRALGAGAVAPRALTVAPEDFAAARRLSRPPEAA